jgi:hypothetical protein
LMLFRIPMPTPLNKLITLHCLNYLPVLTELFAGLDLKQ